MNQKIILTRGIPASGKTYWAENFVKEQGADKWCNINRDNLRMELFGKYFGLSHAQENEITKKQFNIAQDCINKKQSIIISDTNLNPKTQEKWKVFAKQNNFEFSYKDFLDTPFEVCVERDKKREKSVGRSVILNFHNKYVVPTLPKHNNKKPNKPYAYIFDIDGTLAKMNNRTAFEWDKVGEDLVNEEVGRVLSRLCGEPPSDQIIFVSGRDSVCKKATYGWLWEDFFWTLQYIDYENQSVEGCVNLFMRAENDTRKDYIVKNEIFVNHINDNYNILGVFDDRDQVVKMWRDWGLCVFQVNYGDF